MLSAAFALNPQLRTLFPDVAKGLSLNRPGPLPDELDLRLAVAIGRRARVTGSMAGFYLFGPRSRGRPIGVMSHAQMHFAPLAWQLVSADAADLLDAEGWPSIRDWATWGDSTGANLDELLQPLPPVRLAREHPEHGWTWSELLTDGNCFVVECGDITTAAGTPSRGVHASSASTA